MQDSSSEDDIEDDFEGVIDLKNYPKLRSRACPTELFSAIGKFTEQQKRAVDEMGFHHIIYMRVNKVPTQLAYWVLDHFNANSSELHLRNACSIPIDIEDVHAVFGFPKGGEKIQTRKRSDVFASEDTFYNQFTETMRERIRMCHLQEKMMDDSAGGDIFRMNFLALITSCLIENTVNGYVATPLLRYMDKENLQSIHNLDWCEYVVRSLIEHKMMWEKNKSNSFGGPILFLTALYVDRVVSHGRRVVDRCFPTIKGWSFSLLRKREKDEILAGGFGGGRVCPRYNLGDDVISGRNEDGPADTVIPPNNCEGEHSHSEDEMAKFAKEFVEKWKLMAGTMMHILMMIERAPNQLSGNPCFKKFVEAGQNLVGCKLAGDISNEAERATQSCEPNEDEDFWNNPDCIAALEEMEKAILKRDEWKKHCFEGPSFSLGLSQNWDAVLDVTRDVERTMHDEAETNKTQEGNIVVNAKTVRVVDRQLRTRKQKVVSEAPTHQMVRRKGNSLKRTEAFLSPFHERVVDASCKIENKEKELYFWLIHKKPQDLEEVVFSYNTVNLRRAELLTLRSDTWLSTHVIDVWSVILNHKEALRATTSPCRFFATTDTCRYVIGQKGWDDAKVQNEFRQSINAELVRTGNHNLQTIDMFFFPILDREHYYILYFDMRKSGGTVIDNSDERDDMDLRRKYGAMPFILQKVFRNYLEVEAIKVKATAVRRACIDRLQMPWRDGANNNDCGIYAMRHMETYMGQAIKSWNCGLKKGNDRRMKCLCIKYCAAILTSDINVHAVDIANDARAAYAMACAQKDILLNELLKDV
ncbi:hypothetical protein C2S52_008607 [Perilla frutescens var. hirtella]|nr:hypothetical protein C2S52_008607 [Perilla frutescens var. hirtella]